MSINILNLDKVNIKSKKLVEDFCLELLEHSASWTKSLLLYGSATGPDYIENKSNINIFMIVNDLNLSHFNVILPIFEKYAKKRIIPPLTFTIHEIENSRDVFPIEFSDIKENHVLLWGDDIFTTLEIKFDNLRLQCEQELKGKILKLRQMYFAVGKKDKEIELFITSTFSSFIPIFKNIIRLKNKIPPNNKVEIIKAVCKEFDLDESVLMAILNDVKGNCKIGEKNAVEFLECYLEVLHKLSVIVDKL